MPDLTHEPQTVTGASWKLEGCLVWKGKHKLESLPGCNLEASPEKRGRRKVEQVEDSSCDRDNDSKVEGDVDMAPSLGPNRVLDRDSNGDNSSYSP
jgi:hypothetical protein